MQESNGQKWTMEIKSKSGWFDLNLREVWAYKDLVYMFVTRDFTTQYKQTILGPLWYLIQPLFTTIIYSVVFGTVANIATDGQPKILFYMSGLLFWNFFSANLLKNADTFTSNANIFGKVYFPRLVVPIAATVSGLVAMAIQLGLLVGMYVYYVLQGMKAEMNSLILIFPLLLLIVCTLSMSLGIIVSSLTTKYRDLKYLVGFGVQLAMWATPIIYPSSGVTNSTLKTIIDINPMTPIIEAFRYSILGSGSFSWAGISYSCLFTMVAFFIGVVIFSKVEKDFMDTV
jgi:lipopolysaccharide transport system permease protein